MTYRHPNIQPPGKDNTKTDQITHVCQNCKFGVRFSNGNYGCINHDSDSYLMLTKHPFDTCERCEYEKKKGKRK